MNNFRSVPAIYAMCRTWQHAWDYTSVKRDGGEYIQGMRCTRCGTEKQVKINAKSGYREGGNRYVYPEDMNPEAEAYKMPKDSGGALSQDERAAVRLEEVLSHFAADDLAPKRRARKKA